MSSQKLGVYSALTAAFSTFIFAISMLIDNLPLAFVICMVLSWSYVTLTCSFLAETKREKIAFGYAGLAFACMYAVFINIVYYTQISTVLQHAATPEILNILTYTPGSWIFALDIFGYGMMAISTFFVAFTIVPKTSSDKWLKILFMIHGLFALGIVLPILPIFQGKPMDNTGVIVLLGWCVFFIPNMVLAANFFRKK